MKCLIPALFILLHVSFHAKADTTWLDHHWHVTLKKSATYYQLDSRSDKFIRKMYRVHNDQLFMTGMYQDSSFNIRSGEFIWYDSNGKVADSIFYKNDRIIKLLHLHPNGQIKTLLIYGDSLRAVYVNSWDEKGNETFIDTFYHDRKGKDCNKDTATLQGIITKEDELWHLRFFSTNTHELVIDSWYTERLCKNRTRYFSNYENGKAVRSVEYGKAGEIKLFKYWKYHKNGVLGNYRVYEKDEKFVDGKNWDTTGLEIHLDTSRIHATPLENIKSWQNKLVKNINNDNSIPWNVRKNYNGNVFIDVKIDDSGNAGYSVAQRSLYTDMDKLILQHYAETPKWTPAVIHGILVNTFFKLSVIYQDGKVINIYKMPYK